MRKIKIERIKYKKKVIIGSLIFISIIIALVLITSKAKYKNIQSIDLASGTINYTPADIDILAINIQNDSGEYESSTIIPTSGYVLSDTSYCDVNGEKDTSIKLTYENGKIAVNDISKKIKCYLYFDKYSAIDTIIGDTTNIEEKTEFTGIATAADTGIYSAPDDYGISYYFRGVENQLNNWVKFAGFYWRIIRVNGNGTVRMIYQGVANGNVSSSNKTGTTTQINKATYMYNHTWNDNAYVGYMMGIPLNGTTQTQNTTSSNSISYEQAHTNTYDSDAKQTIDNWYKTNIEDKGLSKYVDVNTGFCNDRETKSGVHSDYGILGFGTNATSYAPLGRLMENGNWKKIQTPSFQCNNKNRDLFTLNIADIGNKKLTYPIGLITSDEVVFAGDFAGKINSTYYLYTNDHYYTMSPGYFAAGYASMFTPVSNSGLVHWGACYTKYGLRPVINLRADTKFTYNNEETKGSETDPYIVV